MQYFFYSFLVYNSHSGIHTFMGFCVLICSRFIMFRIALYGLHALRAGCCFNLTRSVLKRQKMGRVVSC